MAVGTPAWISVLEEQQREASEFWTPFAADYRALRGAGATPLEALDAILSTGNVWDKPSLLVNCLPGGLGPKSLMEILQRHQIHPLSLALCYGDRRRALKLLQRLGLEETYGSWIGPGGRFLLQDPLVERLPPGLLLRGDSLIADCPALVDLGGGLKCMIGNLTITRCPRLLCLPDGLETMPLTGMIRNPDGSLEALGTTGGDLILENCPILSSFGKGTKVRGQVIVEGCAKLQRHLQIVTIDAH